MSYQSYVDLIAAGLRNDTVKPDTSVQLRSNESDNTPHIATFLFWDGVASSLERQLKEMSLQQLEQMAGDGYFTYTGYGLYALNAERFKVSED